METSLSAHMPALNAFKALFETKSSLGLEAILADNIVLKPPTYAKAWNGKARVVALLGYAAANIDRLSYTRLYSADLHYALYFEAEIGGIPFTGIDLLSFDGVGRISEIEIEARPPKAVAELSKRMGTSIQDDPLFQI